MGLTERDSHFEWRELAELCKPSIGPVLIPPCGLKKLSRGLAGNTFRYRLRSGVHSLAAAVSWRLVRPPDDIDENSVSTHAKSFTAFPRRTMGRQSISVST